MHDWSSGEVQNEYGLGDYKTRFGTVRFYPVYSSETVEQS